VEGGVFYKKAKEAEAWYGAMQGNEDLNDFTRKVIGEWCNLVW